ncbi:hypothetical protein FA15DRAFT_548484, partial [Coprinopsis marcescibilis]
LGWSPHQSTQAVQKLPTDWEDQCIRSCLRKAYVIKEHDIPASLFINSDQTQLVYAPGDKMTWSKTGEKQVKVVNVEEKRAITVMVSVASDGQALPLQAIYTGKSSRSLPNSAASNYDDAINAGFRLVSSMTATYWSNQTTMKDFANDILAPYISAEIERLGLPPNQKALWTIDVFSVHCSREFCMWMKENHPNIFLDYVPGGCT